MTTNLPDLLQQLATVAPDVCQHNFKYSSKGYNIGEYTFWFSQKDELITAPLDSLAKNIGGQPALDWLQGALQRVIEARGWYWEVDYQASAKRWRCKVVNCEMANIYKFSKNNTTEALLTALIAACEADK